MSWDVSVEAITRTMVYDRNVTWNNASIFREALGCHFRDLNGKTGKEVRAQLQTAIADIMQHPHHYQVLEPSNGWGGIEDALDVLNGMLRACEDYAECDCEIHVE